MFPLGATRWVACISTMKGHPPVGALVVTMYVLLNQGGHGGPPLHHYQGSYGGRPYIFR